MSDTSLVFNILAKDKASATFRKLKGVAAGAGVAIGAALAVGVAGALEKSKSDAMLAAQLGAGPEVAAKLGKASGDLYARGVVDSIEEANAAIKGAISNGLVPDDAAPAAIDAVAGKVANLSKIMEEDAGRVSAAVSQMLRTGMAKNAEEAFDLLHRGFELGVDKSDDLLDTINEYGTQFRNMGLDGKMAMGLLSQGLQAGARDADVVADAIKEFSIEAVAGSDKIRGGYEELGLSADKMFAMLGKGGASATEALDITLDALRAVEDPVERNAIAVELFGTKAEDLGNALYALDPSSAVDALGDVEGAAERAGEKLEGNAGAKLEGFKRKVQQALVEKLGEAVPYIEKTFGWLSKNSAWVTPLATGLATLAIAIGAIVLITKIWTAVQTAFNIVMALNPVALIVIGILALIAVIVLIATKTTWFQDLWETVWDAIKAAASAVWDFLVAAFETWWSIFSGFWKGVGTFFTKLWDGIVNGVKTAWNWIVDKFDKVVEFVSGLKQKLTDKARGMWDGIKNSFKSAINWILGKWNGLSFKIPGVSIPGIGQVWGGMTLSLPKIPMLAKGGTAVTAGLAVVGERGPELVNLNKGAQVTPLRSGGRAQRAELELAGEREIVAFLRRLIKTYRLLEA